MGMWKADLEGMMLSGPEQLWRRLHGVSGALLAADFAGHWRRAQVASSGGGSGSQAALVENSGRREFKALVEGRLLSVFEAPATALVWAGPEAEMHQEPWRFGHAAGARNGRRSCSR